MMKKILLIIIGVIFFSEAVQAQTMRFNAEQYIDEEGDTLNYRIAFPDFSGSESYPVVIFLHGGGERGNDNISQLKWGVQNFVTDHAMMTKKAIVLAPQSPEDERWSNFEGQFREDGEPLRLASEPSKPLKMTMEVLDQLIENFSVDTDRIYITGMSMGGFGTWDAIARWPERFAAAVPVCGGGDPSTAERIAHIPIWATHGADDPTVPPEMSRQMIEALQEAGGLPGYTEYPGVGHFSWLQTYTDDYLISWMFSQRKK
ncbi:MAG: prolyl oligopeptidase family serine peptidase [Balneolaceae bacterium]